MDKKSLPYQIEKVNSCSTHISFHDYSLKLYPVSVKIVRNQGFRFKGGGKRGEIKSFSWGSKARLRFTAVNAFPPLISQFGMTYHQRNPDGREVKKDLYDFLKRLSRKYPEAKYLWILEFQKRAVVHFHMWLTLPVSRGLHEFLANTWHEIAEPESDYHLWWHLRDGSEDPKENNFIPWEMRGAGYLCKYLDKERQKMVPEGFVGVGRFWGCSKGLVGKCEEVSEFEIQKKFSHGDPVASTKILRHLCKSQEKKLNGKKWIKKKWINKARKSIQGYTLIEGRGAYEQLKKYYEEMIKKT